MVLNMVMAIMTGFERELKNRITDTNSHIVVRPADGRLEQWESTAAKIMTVSGVESVSPFTQHQALLRTRDRSSGLIIRGVAQDSTAADQLRRYLVNSQDLPALFDPPLVEIEDGQGGQHETKLPGLVIGRELARSLGLYKGATVSVLAPQVSSSPFGLVPRFRRFLVVGVYASGLVEYESGLAYTSLAEAQRFFEWEEAVSGLEIRVQDVDASALVTRKVMEALGGLSSGLYAQDWTETNKPLWDALRLEKKVYFLVLLLIVVMASFSIVTTLIMLVLEKRKDIAIMRTMGASSRSIGLIFFIQGAVIGVLGTGLGLAAGYLGCVALREYGFPLDERIFQMSTVPVQIEPVNFLVVGICAFVICCASTIYPARRASRLRPNEILRYE